MSTQWESEAQLKTALALSNRGELKEPVPEQDRSGECLVVSGHREVPRHAMSLHVRQVTGVVLTTQVEAGGGVAFIFAEEQFTLQLRVDLYPAADQGMFGRETSV